MNAASCLPFEKTLSPCSLLDRLSRPVHLDLVGALVHGLYFSAYLRHLGLAEVPDRGQREELLGVPAARADLDEPGRWRVVLDLMAARGVVGAGLVDHQDPLV